MKGLAFVVLPMVFLLGAFFFIAFLIAPSLTGKVGILTFQQDIQTMDSALKTGRQYAIISSHYSLHQTCYDQLETGKLLPEDELLEKLRKGTEDGLNTYTKDGYTFMDYSFRFPRYSVTIPDKTPTAITLKATGANLEFKQETPNLTVRLESPSGFEETVPTNCWALYLTGQGLNASLLPTIQNTARGYMRGLPADPPKQTFNITDLPQDPIGKCRKVFEKVESRSIKDLQNELAAQVDKLVGNELSKLNLQFFNISYNSSLVLGSQETLLEERLNRTSGLVDLRCSFAYLVEYLIQINLTDKRQAFPVWNGTNISFENLDLRFEISGNQSTEGLIPLEAIDLTGTYNLELDASGFEPPFTDTIELALFPNNVAFMKGVQIKWSLEGDILTITNDVSVPLGPAGYQSFFTLTGQIGPLGKKITGTANGTARVQAEDRLFSGTFAATKVRPPQP